MSAAGAKIIKALEEAQRGQFARVTVSGHTWIKSGALDEIFRKVEGAARVMQSSDFSTEVKFYYVGALLTELQNICNPTLHSAGK